MRVFNRKSELERLFETGEDAVHTLASSLSKGKVIKIAGGFAALTAASAGISSLRRRDQGTRAGS
jgi:hypothetical protein